MDGWAPWSLELGENYLVETLTFYFTGRLSRITVTDLVLDECAKVFDTDRLSRVLESGPQGFFESEFLGDGVIIRQNVIVLFKRWPHKLPRTIETPLAR